MNSRAAKMQKLITSALCQQSISPGCPAQPAQVPQAPHLALVEVVAEGQAHAQRYPRWGRDRGTYQNLEILLRDIFGFFYVGI